MQCDAQQNILADSKIILPSDIAVRKWHSGSVSRNHDDQTILICLKAHATLTFTQVINPNDDWQVNKFTVRRRIFVLERLLEEEVKRFYQHLRKSLNTLF